MVSSVSRYKQFFLARHIVLSNYFEVLVYLSQYEIILNKQSPTLKLIRHCKPSFTIYIVIMCIF
jgi:hypothetical protein